MPTRSRSRSLSNTSLSTQHANASVPTSTASTPSKAITPPLTSPFDSVSKPPKASKSTTTTTTTKATASRSSSPVPPRMFVADRVDIGKRSFAEKVEVTMDTENRRIHIDFDLTYNQFLSLQSAAVDERQREERKRARKKRELLKAKQKQQEQQQAQSNNNTSNISTLRSQHPSAIITSEKTKATSISPTLDTVSGFGTGMAGDEATAAMVEKHQPPFLGIFASTLRNRFAQYSSVFHSNSNSNSNNINAYSNDEYSSATRSVISTSYTGRISFSWDEISGMSFSYQPLQPVQVAIEFYKRPTIHFQQQTRRYYNREREELFWYECEEYEYINSTAYNDCDSLLFYGGGGGGGFGGMSSGNELNTSIALNNNNNNNHNTSKTNISFADSSDDYCAGRFPEYDSRFTTAATATATATTSSRNLPQQHQQKQRHQSDDDNDDGSVIITDSTTPPQQLTLSAVMLFLSCDKVNCLEFIERIMLSQDTRLKNLAEKSLPSWAVLVNKYPHWTYPRPVPYWYSHRLRVVVSYLVNIYVVISLLWGFYDLYKNIPIIGSTIRKVFDPAVQFFEPIVHHRVLLLIPIVVSRFWGTIKHFFTLFGAAGFFDSQLLADLLYPFTLVATGLRSAIGALFAPLVHSFQFLSASVRAIASTFSYGLELLFAPIEMLITFVSLLFAKIRYVLYILVLPFKTIAMAVFTARQASASASAAVATASNVHPAMQFGAQLSSVQYNAASARSLLNTTLTTVQVHTTPVSRAWAGFRRVIDSILHWYNQFRVNHSLRLHVHLLRWRRKWWSRRWMQMRGRKEPFSDEEEEEGEEDEEGEWEGEDDEDNYSDNNNNSRSDLIDDSDSDSDNDSDNVINNDNEDEDDANGTPNRRRRGRTRRRSRRRRRRSLNNSNNRDTFLRQQRLWNQPWLRWVFACSMVVSVASLASYAAYFMLIAITNNNNNSGSNSGSTTELTL